MKKRMIYTWLCFVMTLVTPVSFGATWTPLVNDAPGDVVLMLLLSDGTVMAAHQPASGDGKGWYRLTPDKNGSYINGTWTTLASMTYSRLWYSSDVLRDGRVFVAGAEYGTGTTNSEVYDPVSNVWTVIGIPPGLILTNNVPVSGENSAGFTDSISTVLPNGDVLVSPNYPTTNRLTLLFDPTMNAWSPGPLLVGRGNQNDQNEASWVKLPDQSILTIDPYGTNSERYIPSLNEWIRDANVPVAIYDSKYDEMGAAFLLPNGKAFFLGGTGHTAIYTPSGTTNVGVWTQGPDLPTDTNGNQLVTADAPAAMMVNGNILCAVSSNYNSSTTYFYSYEYTNGPNGAFVQDGSPVGGFTDNTETDFALMLALPDGTILYSHYGPDLYVYKPNGSPLPAGKPGIISITPNADGSYHLTGTLLSGISQGAAFGDDAQMDSNYPLVRLTNSLGNVYYERTYNWSSTSVMTGSAIETTEFNNSAGLPPGTYSLVVTVNGISSDPVNFLIQPKLAIAASGQNVILTWPTNAVGFQLETTTSLGSGAVWTTNSTPPTIVGGVNTVTNQRTGAQRFYRLSQ